MPAVLLVHGLYVNGWDMRLLGQRLNEAGFSTHYFSYPSMRNTPMENAAGLNAFIKELNLDAVHLVGHSLGGLVIRYLFATYPAQPPGRVVTLGSPHNGSSAARSLERLGLRGLLLGKSAERGLLDTTPPWTDARDHGVIAGQLRLGLGCLLPGIPSPSDGTVTVAETKLEGITAHVTVNTSHFGLLLSPLVARETVRFLQHGCFETATTH